MASRNTGGFYEDDYNDKYSYSSRAAVSGSSGNPFQGGKDPFLDEDNSEPPLDPFEELQNQKQASMNRQLQSTQRAMASIYDSESMGIATAEELVQQGEQLDNAETKLDGINQDMKTSQRHLNNIKSIFGGMKNWWKGEPKEAPPPEPVRRRPETSLATSLEASSSKVPPASSMDHPGMRTRGLYDDDVDTSQRQQTSKSKAMQEYDESLDKNLDMMSDGLARLKGLGMGLGEEIGAQNEQIDRITNKSERADTTIKGQNRQIRGILGK